MTALHKIHAAIEELATDLEDAGIFDEAHRARIIARQVYAQAEMDDLNLTKGD